MVNKWLNKNYDNIRENVEKLEGLVGISIIHEYLKFFLIYTQ